MHRAREPQFREQTPAWGLTSLTVALLLVATQLGGCKHAQSSKGNGAVSPAATSAAVGEPQAATPTQAAPPPSTALPPSLDTLDLDESEMAIVRQIVTEQFDPCGRQRSFKQSLEAGDCALADRLGRFVVRGVQKGYGKRRMVGMLLREIERLNTVVAIKAGTAPRLGPTDSRLIVIVFSDFECPYCRRLAEPLKKMQKHYGAVVYFKHFPLRNHSFAEPAARAAWAAQQQDRFWEMHDQLFAHSDKLDWESVKGYGKQIGLDLKRFAADVESEAAAKAVAADYKEGTEAGVDGTPTVFINGRRAEAIDQVENALREQLKLMNAPVIPPKLDLSQGGGDEGGAGAVQPAEGQR